MKKTTLILSLISLSLSLFNLSFIYLQHTKYKNLGYFKNNDFQVVESLEKQSYELKNKMNKCVQEKSCFSPPSVNEIFENLIFTSNKVASKKCQNFISEYQTQINLQKYLFLVSRENLTNGLVPSWFNSSSLEIQKRLKSCLGNH